MSNRNLLYKCQRQIIFAIHLCQEHIEDTKEVIRSGKSKKTFNAIPQRKRTKVNAMIYKTLHKTQMIEQNEPH